MRLHLTRSAEHGLRIVEFLASTDHWVPSRQIAETTRVPSGYVPSIIALLSRSGILSTRPGPDGGCTLRRRPDELTVREVVEALEGPLVRDSCLLDHNRRHNEMPCGLHAAWMEAEAAIVSALESVTVADLVEWNWGRSRRDRAPTP